MGAAIYRDSDPAQNSPNTARLCNYAELSLATKWAESNDSVVSSCAIWAPAARTLPGQDLGGTCARFAAQAGLQRSCKKLDVGFYARQLAASIVLSVSQERASSPIFRVQTPCLDRGMCFPVDRRGLLWDSNYREKSAEV